MQPPSVLTAAHPRPASTTRSRWRGFSLAALALLLVPVLAGCLRVQVSMGVSADDRVSGQIVAATVPEDDQDQGPQLTPPAALSDKIRVQEYRQDGYVGSQAFFSDLTFGDVQQLGSMSDQGNGSFQVSLRRAGDLVTLDGRADLGSVPAQGTDVQVTVAFPAKIITTNGTLQSDSTVSWTLPAGTTSTLRAEVRYQDPSTRSFAGWAGIMGGVTLGVAVVVAALAWMARNKEPVFDGRRSNKHRSNT